MDALDPLPLRSVLLAGALSGFPEFSCLSLALRGVDGALGRLVERDLLPPARLPPFARAFQPLLLAIVRPILDQVVEHVALVSKLIVTRRRLHFTRLVQLLLLPNREVVYLLDLLVLERS